MKLYNEIIESKKMTIDEAIDIIDKMYQDRMKQIEENNTIYVGRLDNIKFTNLEVAWVILLREVIKLKRELKNSISKEKIESEIEDLDLKISSCEYADEDPEEYKKEVEKEETILLGCKKILRQLLEE